jgi:hypothetical protein
MSGVEASTIATIVTDKIALPLDIADRGTFGQIALNLLGRADLPAAFMGRGIGPPFVR